MPPPVGIGTPAPRPAATERPALALGADGPLRAERAPVLVVALLVALPCDPVTASPVTLRRMESVAASSRTSEHGVEQRGRSSFFQAVGNPKSDAMPCHAILAAEARTEAYRSLLDRRMVLKARAFFDRRTSKS